MIDDEVSISDESADESDVQLPPADEVEDTADELESEDAAEVGAVDIYSIATTAFTLSELPADGVITLTGVLDNVIYTFLIPIQYLENIYISSDGYLLNVGVDTIVGRAFLSDSFDSADYGYYVLEVDTALGNTANQVYRYHSLTSLRHYFEQNGRLASDTTYGDIQVQSINYDYGYNPDYSVNLYLVILIFVGGVIIFCLLRKSMNLLV